MFIGLMLCNREEHSNIHLHKYTGLYRQNFKRLSNNLTYPHGYNLILSIYLT